MVRHGKIVVATDFSEASNEALRQAMQLAHAFDAEIHLLHVMEPFMLYDSDSMLSMPVEDLTRVRLTGARERLEAQAAPAGDAVRVHTRVVEDMRSPAAAICEEAKAMQADVIVVGRHGHEGFLEHLLIGSTAERVVRHAPCTVLVAYGAVKSREESS